MSSRIRSSSMGATPRPKKHFTSRAESAAPASLDVRCACQFFQSESLLPERINPVGIVSRPTSSQGYFSRPISPDSPHVFEPENKNPTESFSFGVVGSTDYYSESSSSLAKSPTKPDDGNPDVTTTNGQQNLPLSSSNGHNISNSFNSDTLHQKDPSQSVLLRRRSESAQRNLENAGRQRDPSSSSILRRRLSEKNDNSIQQMDLSKSTILRRKMDSQGSLPRQSSGEEPLDDEPKLNESKSVRKPKKEPPTNAERFMLSKNTFQTKPAVESKNTFQTKPAVESKNTVPIKPSVDLADLYRETMTFADSEQQEQTKPKTYDVGIIDLMSLGTSFIQKEVGKDSKRNSKRDSEIFDETPTTSEDVVDKLEKENEESTANDQQITANDQQITANDQQNTANDQQITANDQQITANDQQTFSTPTSSALVHIGQNIYIEEPDEPPKETPTAPAKNERLSRRDYPDKSNKKVEDEANHEAEEFIGTTLLPRDLREQSITVSSRKIAPEKPLEFIKQRDLSTSSLLRKRYSRNCSSDSQELGESQDEASAPPRLIKQRDPSSSSLLRKRYSQNLDNPAISDDAISNGINKLEKDEQLLNSEEGYDKKDVCIDNGITNTFENPHEETTRNLSSSMAELRERLNWIERAYNPSDHEYEPIGQSTDTQSPNISSQKDLSHDVADDTKTNQEDNSADAASITSHEKKLLRSTNIANEDDENAQERRAEERFLAPTPQTDQSRNDEICTSQVDSSAIEDLPLRREDRKKSFMASTSDKTRSVQRKLRNQAGRLKSKFKEMQRPKEEDSPKSERKRFRSPEFNKLKSLKMPKISKPELKRPEFTKFNAPIFKKPDFKFTKPDFSSLRLNRKKSNASEPTDSVSDESKMTRTTDEGPGSSKKRFDFGTYPRIFDRMRRDNKNGGGGTTISRDTEPDEECDRVTGPVEFATVPRSSRKKTLMRSKWSSNTDDDSSGKFKHYSLDRESSIEKRMRLDFNNSMDDTNEDDEERGILQTEEQRQFADYDKENRAIHEISKAKEFEFKQRKPLVHQESEVSEASNKEFGWVDTDHLRNRLMTQSGDLDIGQKEDYGGETSPEKDHLSTQETQSSGSSSNRRRKGVIEEIDDDEFFLRKKGISQDDIQIGRYISAAIREGLDTPMNALAQLGQYDSYYDEDFDISNERVDYGYDVPPRKPRRVKDFEKSLEAGDFEDKDREIVDDDRMSPDNFFQTYPPSRPLRKPRKQLSEESHDEHQVPVAAEYYPPPDEDDHLFYENKHMEGIEQPDIKVTYNDDIKSDFNVEPSDDQAPPKAPKRRKHILRESMERDSLANNLVGRSVSNSYLTNGNAAETVVFRTEHEYIVPLVQPETFNTPTPTPRSRSRSRSQISPLTDDDRTSHGAESLAFDETKHSADLKETNGYAIVKKEPPPRPPAPVRRKRSTRSLGDRQFFTMPLRRNHNDLAPERPVRNYSTIGPMRPARRVSLSSLGKQTSVTSDATQYEEIEDVNSSGGGDSKDHKADQNYKMKHRPLPPPPRPPRERKHRKSESDSNKLDKDGGGEKITTKTVLEDISRISSQDMEEIEEMERSTQTDPLPDDYLCEEFDINSDMPIIEPSFSRHSKTLEDILKEEQQAELERARQIADENSLTKGIQKFREANQRSLSERSRGSTNDRSKTPTSRPITPSAVVIEKKVNVSTVETDARLIVQPVDEDVTDAAPSNRQNRFFHEDTFDTEDERIVNEALKRYNLLDSDFRDSSPVLNKAPQNIELNIRDVEPQEMPQEMPQERPQEMPQEQIIETPPQAPPRRKSSCAEPTVAPVTNENENENLPILEERPDSASNLLPGNRLQINELEVDCLNVHALQAGRILVSDLQAVAISSQDIECTSGDLTVKGIKLPPGFIEELINRSRAPAVEEPSRDQDTSTQTPPDLNSQETPNNQSKEEEKPQPPVRDTTDDAEPPARPPPPSLYPSDYTPYSLPPPSFYQLRSYADEVEEVFTHSPTAVHRRRRHHRRRDSTSEEEEQREHRRSRQHSNRSPEPSITDLSGQLIRACGSAIGRNGVKLYAVMKEKKQEMKRRDVNIGIAILIFVVAFLMIIGMGERTVHHHHWDYLNPPDNSGRR